MTRQMRFVVCVLLLLPITIAAQRSAPPARSGHVMTTAGPDGGVLMLGGAADTDDALWRLGGRTWESLGAGGPVNRTMMAAAFDTRRKPGPDGLGHLAMAYDRRRQRVVLFGGDAPEKPDTGDGVRRARERVILSGGSLGARPFSALDDTWEWDGGRWREVSSPRSR